MSTPDTIVLIHGFWVTPRSWEHWKTRYEAKGYTVHTPGYPGFEGEVEALLPLGAILGIGAGQRAADAEIDRFAIGLCGYGLADSRQDKRGASGQQ